MEYDSDELMYSEWTSILELKIAFQARGGAKGDEKEFVTSVNGETVPALKVEELEKHLQPLVKEKKFDFKKFKDFFKDNAPDDDGWYTFNEKMYDWLRPFLPYFPDSFDFYIDAFWRYYESNDLAFFGRSFFQSGIWLEEHEEEFPKDIRGLFYFDSEETGIPFDWLDTYGWEGHGEEVREWFKKRREEEGEEYDEDEINFYYERYWYDFFDAFPEAFEAFKEYVLSI